MVFTLERLVAGIRYLLGRCCRRCRGSSGSFVGSTSVDDLKSFELDDMSEILAHRSSDGGGDDDGAADGSATRRASLATTTHTPESGSARDTDDEHEATTRYRSSSARRHDDPLAYTDDSHEYDTDVGLLDHVSLQSASASPECSPSPYAPSDLVPHTILSIAPPLTTTSLSASSSSSTTAAAASSSSELAWRDTYRRMARLDMATELATIESFAAQQDQLAAASASTPAASPSLAPASTATTIIPTRPTPTRPKRGQWLMRT